MSNKILKLILLLCCIVSSSFAKIHYTTSVHSNVMSDLISQLDSDTAVIIEVDDTILIPESKFFTNGSSYKYYLSKMIARAKNSSSHYKTLASLYQNRKMQLVENEWPDIIQKMQQKEVSVFGMFNMPIQLINIERNRYFQLNEFGINFTENINGQNVFAISGLQEGKKNNAKNPWFPKFYSGMIFSDPRPEHITLVNLMKVTNLLFKKVLFISNDEKKVKLIKNSLRRFDLDYYGLVYLGKNRYRVEHTKENDAVMNLQEKLLRQHGIWLEDDAALQLLKEETKNSEEK